MAPRNLEGGGLGLLLQLGGIRIGQKTALEDCDSEGQITKVGCDPLSHFSSNRQDSKQFGSEPFEIGLHGLLCSLPLTEPCLRVWDFTEGLILTNLRILPLACTLCKKWRGKSWDMLPHSERGDPFYFKLERSFIVDHEITCRSPN